jgi:hypothetical protein
MYQITCRYLDYLASGAPAFLACGPRPDATPGVRQFGVTGGTNGIDVRPHRGLRDATGPDRLRGMTAPARVVVILEPDYQFGMGELRLRVERVDLANPVRYDGENWYRVEGVQLTKNGAEVGARQVPVYGRRPPPS